MKYTVKTIRAYEEIAEQFTAKNIHKLTVSVPLLEEFRKRLPGKEILEIGFGEGSDARWFINNGFNYTGVDPVSVFLNRDWTKNPNIKIVNQDILKVDFPTESFDGIWAMAVFLHFKDADVRKVVRKCYKWLKPNGIMYISLKEGTGTLTRDDGRFFNFFTKEKILKMTNNLFQLEEFSVRGATSWNTGNNNWLNLYFRKR